MVGLMCDKETDDLVFDGLLYFTIKLLEGGNEKVQQDFYQYFITMSNSSVFFNKINKCMNEHIERLNYAKEQKKPPIFQQPENQIVHILKILQLLCENHNHLVQNYLRLQINSRTNIDLINMTILLLEELMRKKSFSHFLMISQCFDTLTEFIQGPCRENQKAIIDSKFLEVASGLLSIDEKSDSLSKYENLLGENLKNSTVSERCLAG